MATRNLAASRFAIWTLPLLLILAVVTPPWMNSDEPFHMLRAVSAAPGAIIDIRSMEKDCAGGPSDPEIYEAYTAINQPSRDKNAEVTAAELANSDAVKWHRALAPAWFDNTAPYPPFFYQPDAASYWIGRSLGLHLISTTVRSSCCCPPAET